MTFWWLDPSSALRWSIEERRAKQAIWGISFPIFLILFLPQIVLFRNLGIGAHVGAIIAILTAIPGALLSSRILCNLFWPDLIKRADANASERLKQHR